MAQRPRPAARISSVINGYLPPISRETSDFRCYGSVTWKEPDVHSGKDLLGMIRKSRWRIMSRLDRATLKTGGALENPNSLTPKLQFRQTSVPMFTPSPISIVCGT